MPRGPGGGGPRGRRRSRLSPAGGPPPRGLSVPELPEVETIRRALAAAVAGRTVERVRVRRPDILMNLPSEAAFADRVEGRRIDRVERRAKYLLLRLSGEVVLEVQLRMTGRFALGERRPDPDEYSHLAAWLRLDDGRALWYDDVRRLGGFKVLSAEAWRRREAELGPEPLEEDYRPARLRRELEDRRAPVKNLLLDQRRVAGVGNIYACESLHAASVDPRRPGGDLGGDEIVRLHSALRDVLGRALRQAGTTLRDYRAPDGRSGRFQASLSVYGREGRPCPRCDGDVRRIVQAGRSTYFCNGCQA